MYDFYIFVIIGIVLLVKGFFDSIKRIEEEARWNAMMDHVHEEWRKGDEKAAEIEKFEKEYRYSSVNRNQSGTKKSV